MLADREVYGTVCFVDLEPRDAPFDDEDRTFLELIANGVGRVLEQQAAAAERQDIPQDLSMGERRCRTAPKHSPVLFAKIDEDLRYEWLYNPHPDFDPEAAVGKRDDELDSGPGIDRLMDLKRRTLERGEQIQEEITFERSDGLNVYDVTDQKREARKRQQVIRRVTDAIVEVDSEWRFTLVNDAAGALYDMAEAELLGKNFWDVFETALGTRFEETYRRVMETREPDSPVEHFPRLDGWFDVEVYPNEDGGLAFYFQEVTEQKEHEAALRRQRNLLEQTQRLAGAWEVDLQSRELSWTEEVYRVHDVPPDADIGLEESFEFFPSEAQAKLRAAFERCVEEGDPYDLELPLVTADDDQRWVRAVGAPAETDGEEVVRVARTFQDITERKGTEEELRTRAAVTAIALHKGGLLVLFSADRNSVRPRSRALPPAPA